MATSFKMSKGTALLAEYEITSILGEGGCGAVFAGTRISDSLPVAVKKVKNQFSSRLDIFNKDLPMEVSFMDRLSHVDGVIKLIDASYEKKTLTIVMERIEDSMDLISFIETGKMTPQLIQPIFRQLVSILIECHNTSVIHRDIKPDNILVDIHTNKIKIIDFGSASYYQDTYPTARGTPDYWPPEVFQKNLCHGVASTVWSLGTTLYFMVKDDFPFDDVENLTAQEAENIWFPPGLSIQCQDLIRKLLCFNWYERPSLEQVLDHPFLQIDPEIPLNFELFEPIVLLETLDIKPSESMIVCDPLVLESPGFILPHDPLDIESFNSNLPCDLMDVEPFQCLQYLPVNMFRHHIFGL